MKNVRQKIVMVGVLAIVFEIAIVLPAPVSATGTTCGGGWCSGSDGSTAQNVQGNNDRIYIGESGVYYTDFNIPSQLPPCPNDPNPDGACFSTTGADGATTVWQNGNGIGVQFYYLGGGAGSSAAPQWGSPYCWGWHQGMKAVKWISLYFSQYIPSGFIIALDIEQDSNFDWVATMTQANRDVFSGFRDYVQEASSADPSNCSNTNATMNYQHGVYSTPNNWNDAMGTHNSLSNTPEWTVKYCCTGTYPGSFKYSSTIQADWYGGSTNSTNDDIWQFDETPDYDIAQEPLYLPHFNSYLGS